MKIRVLHTGADFIVIDKPPLVDSQNSKEGRPSVVNWLEEKYGFSGLVHRLDFGTSGAMVCALNPIAAKRLTTAIANRSIRRIYHVFVLGRIEEKEGVFQDELEGQTAETSYEVLELFANATLVEATLGTGRKHQIRQHFSMHGHGVLGDHLHGKKGAKLLFHRPALHAAKLVIDGVIYECPHPDDLASLHQKLKGRSGR